MNELYADGGVIDKNPSAIGGTWAYRIVSSPKPIIFLVGYITPKRAKLPSITNNLTEMLALVRGLEALPTDWVGTVYSDSQITLGRAFEGWKWNGIPDWLHHDYQDARKHLLHWDQINHILLSGHPTRAQLAAGIGKNGRPVSIHNVWCDKACSEMAKTYREAAHA